MKRHLLLTTLASFTLVASAQKIHLTDTANRWTLEHQNGITGEAVYDTYTYKMGADTIIRGVSYRKIEIVSHQNRHDGMFSGSDYGKEYIGSFFREDTITNRAYCITSKDTNEHLIYDASWQVGDSVSFSSGIYKGVIKVAKFDSTFISNAWYRVFRMTTKTNSGSTIGSFAIIEGIGSTSGTGTPAFPMAGENRPWLRCFYNAGNRPVISPAISLFDNAVSCLGTSGVSVAGGIEAPLSVIPNPGGSEMRIELPANIKPGFIKVIDGFGKLIVRLPVEEGVRQIPVGRYLKTPGVYYFVLESADGYRLRERLLFL